ncbi:uncharacterized protein LOC128269003 [Anopheles cruzii]|uniref:uncharacterized protein LOC128269003 n=1 Tax=Anopheles cruzii TaxID=68878 RepID=UPI0022EC3240|nr:uncharacterized protein LOC128269003 [Anopheles cruzii]XP_052862292.1 uncharacterized protein LOC128269003 [Anopheles cruzii]XP_052862293.1 uncharacterized protein LOC128269003 [Anopheles cruzii]
MEERKPFFEAKHCLSLKCVLFLFYGGLGCIYPFLQSNMAKKGFAYDEIYSISVIIPLAALLGPLVFALLADKWATGNAFAYGKRLRILTAVTLIASIVLYVLLMFAVARTPPPEVCQPQASFLCNRKGAFIVQEKCSDGGVCHDWEAEKSGLLTLENCTYRCQSEAQFESNCYARQAKSAQLAAWIREKEEDQDDGTVLDLGSGQGTVGRDSDGDGIPDVNDPESSNDLDGDGIPNDQDPDDDNDGLPDDVDNDDDNDGIPDDQDVDDDNDGIPDTLEGKARSNDLDGPDTLEGKARSNDLDGDGIPDAEDDDDDNDGIPDADDDDDDNDGVPDSQETVLVPTAIVCVDGDEEDELCHTYSEGAIQLKAKFDGHGEKDEGTECSYPLDGFRCPLDKAWVKEQPAGCKPVVQCDIVEPYEDAESLLHGTLCDGDEDNDGDDDEGDGTFYYYLSVRSLLDFFLLAALTLLNTIIVVATRDPASGVADFGRQLVWGAVGWIIFFNDDFEQPYMVFVFLYTTAAVILLSPLKMDLSPAEDWWQFRTVPQKFLSMPPLRKYFQRCWLPFLVAIGLGSLWSVIDSIDESHIVDLPEDEGTPKQSTLFRTFIRTVLLAGDLLAIPVLVYSRRIIDAFGACKILVAAFLSLVVRFILLAILDYSLWDVVEDWLLPTTLGLTWITLVLHFRDLLPRKVSALAQALPVIAHFGFGRFFGALIGIEHHFERLENDYEVLAGVLFGVTIISIVLYRYREIVLTHVGKCIPALKPADANGCPGKAKGETNV